MATQERPAQSVHLQLPPNIRGADGGVQQLWHYQPDQYGWTVAQRRNFVDGAH